MGNQESIVVPTPEELLRRVYRLIDSCFARGMDLRDVLVEVEGFIASFER